ncbi:bifunctional ornithine acetyltransferase/N-acetylglutamate synthase [Iningainema tapete]|uniref:Arginine biosynthesis bifunctional protein ArgJ n=1 Tax=Iningainema tapete BLCC-T55 TaxID=2748662 RepID=A0A8J7C8B0_9CYAN|nr:bifunctional ornithine acetyltransferase/N-acetylglutamate synthase [Iningainema tapete]MBD2774376.1 bifunctional ornithine acetyltransferase/N-acetylglutamate synthase [Iningainema tapete BLCC-T55]
MTDWQEISGGVTAPKGYQAAGITAGLKPSGLPDLALIYSPSEAIAAGVFTTSQVKAACVDYCRQRLHAKHSARAILCNAGQANAATGSQGWFDALESAMSLGQALNIPSESILLASTGVIGRRIPMDILKAGIPKLVAALSETGSDAAASAIVTTDLVTKSIALETTIGDRPVRVGGIAKGSGMIHPNMATLLAFVTCDAAVSPSLWQQMLSRAAQRSFNSITVDGDTSTNDSLIALANGQSRTPAITEMGAEAERLEAMLTAVCQHLAKAIARDGEGATCLVEVQVSGAPDEQSARQIAKTIAGSSLVKSAIFGRDPNWGRIAAAAGRAGVPFEQENLKIQLGNFLLMENGQPLPFDRTAASGYLKQAAADSSLPKDVVATNMSNDLSGERRFPTQRLDNPVIIAVSVGNGSGSGKAWGCDLSYDYVKINAEYTT